jgi:hypothetical protein
VGVTWRRDLSRKRGGGGSLSASPRHGGELFLAKAGEKGREMGAGSGTWLIRIGGPGERRGTWHNGGKGIHSVAKSGCDGAGSATRMLARAHGGGGGQYGGPS